MVPTPSRHSSLDPTGGNTNQDLSTGSVRPWLSPAHDRDPIGPAREGSLAGSRTFRHNVVRYRERHSTSHHPVDRFRVQPNYFWIYLSLPHIIPGLRQRGYPSSRLLGLARPQRGGVRRVFHRRTRQYLTSDARHDRGPGSGPHHENGRTDRNRHGLSDPLLPGRPLLRGPARRRRHRRCGLCGQCEFPRDGHHSGPWCWYDGTHRSGEREEGPGRREPDLQPESRARRAVRGHYPGRWIRPGQMVHGQRSLRMPRR